MMFTSKTRNRHTAATASQRRPTEFGRKVPALLAMSLLAGFGTVIGAGAAGASTTAAPSAPSSVVAAAGNADASLSWTAPANTGNHPLAGYYVTAHMGAVT